MLDTGYCPSRPEGYAPARCRRSRLITGDGERRSPVAGMGNNAKAEAWYEGL